MEPKMLTLVAIGGAIGAVLRYLVGEWLPNDFPWGTLTVNLIGSLLLGMIVGLSVSEEMALLLGTGLMGAFTTMSAYSVDIVKLFDEGKFGTTSVYIIMTLIGCPLLAYVGWKFSTQFA
ncbi:MAG: fluoride efflux transporter CrcB [Candidatus Thalassarchaeaceae archaeon]|jgi:CrcB protein|nr:fluoride efflux transporter CrcB [Candidatus Thalassarchaeaceae archaeon]